MDARLINFFSSFSAFHDHDREGHKAKHTGVINLFFIVPALLELSDMSKKEKKKCLETVCDFITP